MTTEGKKKKVTEWVKANASSAGRGRQVAGAVICLALPSSPRSGAGLLLSTAAQPDLVRRAAETCSVMLGV